MFKMDLGRCQRIDETSCAMGWILVAGNVSYATQRPRKQGQQACKMNVYKLCYLSAHHPSETTINLVWEGRPVTAFSGEKIYIQPSDIRLRPFFSVMSISTTVSTLKIGFQWEGKFRYISPFPLLDCPFALALSISLSVCQVMTHRMVLLHFHLFFLIV